MSQQQEHEKHFIKYKEIKQLYLTLLKRSDIMYMFEVCAKCGHVGKGNYVNKIFAIKAKSGKEAAYLARSFPRVKHHHQDAIRYVKRIDKDRYDEIISVNSSDLYFQCNNIQEQRALCELEILEEVSEDNQFSRKKEQEHKPTFYGKYTLRNPKKYINNYAIEKRYVI